MFRGLVSSGKDRRQEASVERSNISGLIVAEAALDPLQVVRDLRKMLKE